MLNKEKKYTMKEFKEIFDKAKLEVIKKDTENNQKNIDDQMAGFMLSMVALNTIGHLEKELFREE